MPFVPSKVNSLLHKAFIRFKQTLDVQTYIGISLGRLVRAGMSTHTKAIAP